MKKVLLPVFAGMCLLVMMVGCKGKTSDPKVVAKSFMDAFKAKDFETAEKFATKESKSVLEMMKSAMTMADSFGGKNGGGDNMFGKEFEGKKIEYSEPKIEGDNATLSMMVDGKEAMPISMKKEDGGWKVAFDKSTLMKTNTDKLNSGGSDSMPLNTPDTMKTMMPDGLEKADTTIK